MNIPSLTSLRLFGEFLGEAFDHDESKPTGLTFYFYDGEVYAVRQGLVRYYCPRWEWEENARNRYKLVL